MVLANYKKHIIIIALAAGVFVVNKQFDEMIKKTRYKSLVGQIETSSERASEGLMHEVTPLVHIATYNESLSNSSIDESVFTAAPLKVAIEPAPIVEPEAIPAKEEVAVKTSEWDAIGDQLKLQSIFGISGKKGVIINGRSRHLGDIISLHSQKGSATKVEIKTINSRSVLLAIGDETKEFTL